MRSLMSLKLFCLSAAAGMVGALALYATPALATDASSDAIIKASISADVPADDVMSRRGRGKDDPPGDDRGRRRGGHGADD